MTHDVIDLSGTRVLIVDDSSTICTAAEAILQRAGCQVIKARDGFAAMAEIVEHRPQVILMDIVMPRLDGYQACAVIKRNHEFRQVPIVMLSNLEHHFDRVRGRLMGISGYLTKPFTAGELKMTIGEHLVPREAG